MSDRRPLGPDNLVTLDEVRAELRCSRARAREVVADVRPYRAGSVALYRWASVLAALEQAEAPPAPAAPRRARRPRAVTGDWA